MKTARADIHNSRPSDVNCRRFSFMLKTLAQSCQSRATLRSSARRPTAARHPAGPQPWAGIGSDDYRMPHLMSGGTRLIKQSENPPLIIVTSDDTPSARRWRRLRCGRLCKEGRKPSRSVAIDLPKAFPVRNGNLRRSRKTKTQPPTWARLTVG